MKLKVYVIVGYLVSSLLTILGLIWAVNRMLIDQRETYFLIGITLVASLVGAVVSLILLSPVFSSLKSLKNQFTDRLNFKRWQLPSMKWTLL